MGGASLEGSFVGTKEIQIIAAALDRPAALRHDVRATVLKDFNVASCGEQEDAAVPEVSPGGKILPGGFGVGLFDEVVDGKTSFGDVEGAAEYLRSLLHCNGKVGVIGYCSGGRQVYLVACNIPSLNAAVDCYGGRVVAAADELTPRTPVAPLDMTADLACPLLGLFGADDESPSPEQVAVHEQELKAHGKDFQFHIYEGAGHGFFYYHRPMYRQEQAVDGWSKVFAFFAKHLGA